MEFLFEVKYKNGQVDRIRIRANIASDAIKQLMSMYSGISSYKLLN